MMVRTKIWVIAAALALLPGVAGAQQANAGAARSEAATADKPQHNPSESPAPAASPSDSQGNASTTVAARADTPSIMPATAPTPDIGQPNGDWRLQKTVTALGREGHWFNDMLLSIMAVVTLIVFGLLAYTMVRYRAARQPIASRTSHNTLIEVIWTAVPVLILLAIGIPSFRLLAEQYDPPKADVTIKAIGHQWYWEYEYPDEGGFSFDSVMLDEQETKTRGEPRLLGVDNRVVVPAGATVKVLTTGADVIHSWAVPAFWVKMDAVPGRINETWFKTDRPGVYYGQCSELCGTKHGFMPIAVEVVTPERYRAWIAAKQAENGIAPTKPGAAAPATAATTAAE